MAYTKKTWQKGEVIKATDLNNMETGVEANDQAISAIRENYTSNGISMKVSQGHISILPPGDYCTDTTTESLVLGGYGQAATGYIGTQVSGGRKIVVGQVHSTGNVQIMMGSQIKVAEGTQTNFPWIAPYLNEQGYFCTTSNSNMVLAIGGCVVTGAQSAAIGYMNMIGGGSLSVGQFNHSSAGVATTLGECLETGYLRQMAIGRANDNKEEDAFEIGNGTYSYSTPGSIERSNAFRVTVNGDAIAQTSLGIEDGNGDVVSITAAQLQALLSNANPTCLVTMTYDSTNNRYVSDKTAGEVYAAYNAAKSVVFKFSDIGYVMWGGKAHAEAFCPNVRMLYNDNAAGVINDPKYIVDGYGPNDITLGIIAPTSADYFIMGVS